MAYFDGQYRKYRATKKAGRKPWRAFHYANGGRSYLGNYATKKEAEEVEYREKLRHQNELLMEFPEEIKAHRQQSLL